MDKFFSYYFLLAFLFLNTIFNPILSQTNVTISGLVSDIQSGDPLVGTNILLYKDSITTLSQPIKGSSTNRYGFYAIPGISKGKFFIIFRNLGFKPVINELNITITQGTLNLNIEMQPVDLELDEIVIDEKRTNEVGLSTIDVSPELLQMLPSISGEVDIFRSLQMLPGVKAASEMSNGLYVRGGSPDQTLTLVDGVVVYNPAHLGNIASTFNSNAVHDIRLIKGAYPAEYGGRLSSVLDIKLRGGTKDREKIKIGIGSIMSFATLEGPVSENVTYMLSSRIMYYDLFQSNFDSESKTPRYNFNDLNSKFNYNFDDNSILSLSGSFNNDHVYSPPNNEDFNYDIAWNNSSLSLNWLKVTDKSIFLNINFSYINYGFKSALDDISTDSLANDYFSSSDLTDIFLKTNFEYIWHEDHKFKAGIEAGLHYYSLLNRDFYDPLLEISPDFEENLVSPEASFFAQNEWKILPTLNTNIGLRLSYFKDSDKFKIEPRISMSYAVSENLYIKSAYAVANQFLHLITRNDITLPTDLWYPSSKKILPSKSEQYVFGFDAYFDDRIYLFSAETYYRTMKNIYEFKDILEFGREISIEENFTDGEGEAYGVEVFLNKRAGDLSGWLGYTLSWSRRLFEEINAGRIFSPRYDRRHDISLVLAYKFYKNLTSSLTWTYASGQGYTIPNSQYLFKPLGVYEQRDSRIQFNYSNRNEFRLPDYHKLDININYSFTYKTYPIEVFLNLQNVYNRKNAFAQYISFDTDEKTGVSSPKLKQITLMPFIPTLGFSIKL